MTYIRGTNARAANDLIDELARLGVKAQVGYSTPNRTHTLLVSTSGDVSKIPATFRGYQVRLVADPLTRGRSEGGK